MKRFADWLIEYRRWVVAAVLTISALLGVAAVQLRLEFHPADLLPQQHPFIEVHNRYHRHFSETNVLTVMVQARQGDIFQQPFLSKLYRLTEIVDGLPGVNHDQVWSLAHRSTRWMRVEHNGGMVSDVVMQRAPTTDAEVRDIRQLVRSASYVLGSMISLDQRAAIIRAGFHEQRLDYRRLFEEVNAKVLPLADDQVAIYVSGPLRENGWILALESQVVTAFAAAVVVTWILLYAYFRDWRGALRPTISGGLAALWGFGLMKLSGFAMNPLTLVIPFLITARAVSHSAQMHDRYYEELAAGVTKGEAIRGTFAELFAPTTAGILTDALGVLAIGIVAIPALRQLAVTATLWLLSLMVTELLLNPIVYSYLRTPSRDAIEARTRGRFARASREWGAVIVGPRGRWVVLAVAGLVVVVATCLLPYVSLGDPTSASNILYADSEYNRDHIAVQETFGGSEPFLVVVEGDRPRALHDATVLRTTQLFQRTLERLPFVGASFSLVDILLSMGERFHELEPKWGVIPSTPADIATMFFTYWGSVFPSTSMQFFTPDMSTAHITFYCRDHLVAHVHALVQAAEQFIATHPLEHVRFRLAGGFVGVMAAVYDEILHSQALMTAASFLVILVVCALTYRSLVAAVLLMVPLAVANLIVNAYMVIRGIGLGIDTLPVIAIGVGFGIDYGIYMLSRVQEAMRDGVRLEDAITVALAHSGRTVAFTALSMAAGMLCFTPTALRFVAEMAALLTLWMVTSAATALTVLPALLVVLRPRFLESRRADRSPTLRAAS